jgi:hypothetical protein
MWNCRYRPATTGNSAAYKQQRLTGKLGEDGIIQTVLVIEDEKDLADLIASTWRRRDSVP